MNRVSTISNDCEGYPTSIYLNKMYIFNIEYFRIPNYKTLEIEKEKKWFQTHSIASFVESFKSREEVSSQRPRVFQSKVRTRNFFRSCYEWCCLFISAPVEKIDKLAFNGSMMRSGKILLQEGRRCWWRLSSSPLLLKLNPFSSSHLLFSVQIIIKHISSRILANDATKTVGQSYSTR